MERLGCSAPSTKIVHTLPGKAMETAQAVGARPPHPQATWVTNATVIDKTEATGLVPVPKRSGQDTWGGIAMLAHCAQSAEQQISPAAGQGQVSGGQGAAGQSAATKGEDGASNYNRKDKSLGLLCDKFLLEYSRASEVCLDASAKTLGVERRRIYDIVNVLESVDVIAKKAKNRYAWFGKANLASALIRLQRMGVPEQEKSGDADDNSDEEVAQNSSNNSGAEGNPRMTMVPSKKGSRREKSLGVLSQKFVRLFLNSPDGVVSLEGAAKKLMGDSNVEESHLKTKIRRLYDIANILCSLGLIEKTHLADGARRPAFKWTYPLDPAAAPAQSWGPQAQATSAAGVLSLEGPKRTLDTMGGAGMVSSPGAEIARKRTRTQGAGKDKPSPPPLPQQQQQQQQQQQGVGGVKDEATGAGQQAPQALPFTDLASMAGAISMWNARGGGAQEGATIAPGSGGPVNDNNSSLQMPGGSAAVDSSPSIMQTYMQCLTQMAGMHSIMTQTAASTIDPAGAASQSATSTGAAASATAGSMEPAAMQQYMQMMLAMISQQQPAQVGGVSGDQQAQDEGAGGANSISASSMAPVGLVTSSTPVTVLSASVVPVPPGSGSAGIATATPCAVQVVAALPHAMASRAQFGDAKKKPQQPQGSQSTPNSEPLKEDSGKVAAAHGEPDSSHDSNNSSNNVYRGVQDAVGDVALQPQGRGTVECPEFGADDSSDPAAAGAFCASGETPSAATSTAVY